MPGNHTSNYSISLSEKDFERKSGQTIGKLRANFVGTQFTLFDDGVSPKEVSKGGVVRKELCHIEYVSSKGKESVWNERTQKI